MVLKALINHAETGSDDEFYTPDEAIYPLIRYIPRDWVIWECTDHGHGRITTLFSERGNKVIASHKDGGIDFLTDYPPFEYDCIITNPPYSIKDKSLQRAFEFGTPFAFLLPLYAIGGIARGKLFRKYGIEILVLDRRINFMKDKKRVWFNVGWFCRDVLPDKLVFAKSSRRGRLAPVLSHQWFCRRLPSDSTSRWTPLPLASRLVLPRLQWTSTTKLTPMPGAQ